MSLDPFPPGSVLLQEAPETNVEPGRVMIDGLPGGTGALPVPSQGADHETSRTELEGEA